MKLSKNNVIIRWIRWLIQKKKVMQWMPTFFRLGGWLPLMLYSLLGIKVLLLTTTGRKSGKPRTVTLMYVPEEQNLVVAAHQAGFNNRPAWYLNLLANPEVIVEVFWRRSTYLAEEITDAESRKKLLGQFPFGMVGALQAHTSDQFPAIRLRPVPRKNESA